MMYEHICINFYIIYELVIYTVYIWIICRMYELVLIASSMIKVGASRNQGYVPRYSDSPIMIPL